MLRHVQRVVARKRMPHTLCSRVVRCMRCGITSGALGQLMFDEPLDTVLLGLLGDKYWGTTTGAITLRWLTLACAPFWWQLGRRVNWRWLQGGLPLYWSWRWTWSLSMYLGLGVFGYLCPLAVLLGLCWV